MRRSTTQYENVNSYGFEPSTSPLGSNRSPTGLPLSIYTTMVIVISVRKYLIIVLRDLTPSKVAIKSYNMPNFRYRPRPAIAQ